MEETHIPYPKEIMASLEMLQANPWDDMIREFTKNTARSYEDMITQELEKRDVIVPEELGRVDAEHFSYQDTDGYHLESKWYIDGKHAFDVYREIKTESSPMGYVEGDPYFQRTMTYLIIDQALPDPISHFEPLIPSKEECFRRAYKNLVERKE